MLEPRKNIKVPSILNKVQTFSLEQLFLYMIGLSHINHTNILFNNFFIFYNVVTLKHTSKLSLNVKNLSSDHIFPILKDSTNQSAGGLI